jgi:transcriptional regulator with XRE-family HTH domain
MLDINSAWTHYAETMHIRQAQIIQVRVAHLYSVTIMDEAPAKASSSFGLAMGKKLKQLREDVRHMSPEDVERLSKNAVSASYIRRLEKGLNSPTVETLAAILETLGSNLGLFFEDMVQMSPIDAQDRVFQRIVQRSLEEHRQDTIAVIYMLKRGLKSS